MGGFKIPLSFSGKSFFEENYIDDKKIEDAITDFIFLLVESPNGSFSPDFQFGFTLKNFRFENYDSENKINQKKIEEKSGNPNNYAADLREIIKKYEPRLQNTEIITEFDKNKAEISVKIYGFYMTKSEGKKDYEQCIKFHVW